jgi:pyruvate/2-oxoglutarate/acetoin dehydrogenase E1 component
METVAGSIRKTHRAVIVHEACRTGGFGAELAARIQAELFDELDAPVLRVGAKDVPIPFSPPLEDFVLPKVADVVGAAKAVCYR